MFPENIKIHPICTRKEDKFMFNMWIQNIWKIINYLQAEFTEWPGAKENLSFSTTIIQLSEHFYIQWILVQWICVFATVNLGLHCITAE